MAGYPHYKNSHAAMQLWEPVYLNLFEVLLTPPPSVDNWDYVMENVKTVSGLDVEKVPGLVEQIYKGAKRRFSAAYPDSTTADIAMSFEVNLDDSNSMYVYKGLRKWCDLIFDPLTGGMVLKKDYVGGPLIVTLHNRAADVIRQWIFQVVWPMQALNMMDLDYSTGSNIYSVDMTFAADYWDDLSV